MKNKKGFTLIELLAVIVILAIIAIIATPIVLNIIGNVQKSAFEQNIKAIDNAIKLANVKTSDSVEYISLDNLPIKIKDNIELKVIYEKGKTYYYEFKNSSYKIDVTKCDNTEYCTFEEIFEKKDVIVKANEKVKLETIVFEKVEDEDPGIIACTNDVGEIRSIEDLVSLSTTPNPCKTIKLAYNLDFNNKKSYASSEIDESLISGEGFKPISDFKSILDGDGKTIRGLYINRPEESNVGLFSKVSGASINAHIKNLNLKDIVILGMSKVGAVVGDLWTSAHVSNINVENAKINGTGSYVAGIAGIQSSNYSKIYAVKVKDSEITSTGDYVAGISGDIWAPISNAQTYNVTLSGKSYVGGITGYARAGTVTTAIVQNGKIKGTDSYVGGIVGYVNSDVKSTLFSGDVEGKTYVGGIAGNSSGKSYGAFLLGSIKAESNYGRTAGSAKGQYLANENITVNGSKVTSTAIGSNNGLDVNEKYLTDLNTLDMVIDTYIGGDNDGDGFYFDYDSNGNIVIKSVESNPLTFDLKEESGIYLINDYEDLKKASLKVGYSYKLANDIDLKNKYLYQLGTTSNVYSGVFDGNNKTLKNITMNTYNASLFGKVSGVNSINAHIKNLNLKDIIMSGVSKVGAVVGDLSGTAHVSNINVENAKINGIGSYVAGIAGIQSSNYSKIYAVKVKDSEITSTGDYVAGISGDIWAPISNAQTYNVTLSGKSYVGGITGYSRAGTVITAIVQNGKIKGTDSYVGGIVGYVNANVKSTVFSGDVEGKTYVGGIAGYSAGNSYGAFLSGSVKAESNYGRISGKYRGNYLANENITVNGSTVISTATNSNNGKSLTDMGVASQSEYEAIGFEFASTDTNEAYWYFNDDDVISLIVK